MGRYQYIMTAPKLEGLSIVEIDRLDLAFGHIFSRYVKYDADTLTDNQYATTTVRMEAWGLHITHKQIDKAFYRFKDSYETYGEHWLRYMKQTWNRFDDLENWARQHTKCFRFTGADPGNLYPLSKDLISQLIDYLKDTPLPANQAEEIAGSLLDDIFSEDELEAYTTGHTSPYSLRIEGVSVLLDILNNTNFDTTHIYLYSTD